MENKDPSIRGNESAGNPAYRQMRGLLAGVLDAQKKDG